MQPTKAPQVPGSFINREKLERNIADSRKQAQINEDRVLNESEGRPESPIVHVPPSDDDAVPGLTSEEAKKKAEQDEKILKIKADCEEALQIKITEEDARACIFKGRLIKDIVVLNSGEKPFKGTFRTLTPKELKEVDQKVAKFQTDTENSFTNQGLKDEAAMILLSYCWMAADGRPLGGTPEERRTTLDQMSAHLVGYATTAWNNFDILVQLALNNGKFIKKS
jgi:hypothetical protein